MSAVGMVGLGVMGRAPSRRHLPSGGRSHHFLKRFPHLLERDFEARFSLRMGEKDLRLALVLAEEAGAALRRRRSSTSSTARRSRSARRTRTSSRWPGCTSASRVWSGGRR